jgi:UDP-glucose 4-epimerase
MKNKKILVTGAAGFIGSNMSEQLIQDNEVVGIDNFSNVDDRFVKLLSKNRNFVFKNGDINDPAFMKSLGKFDLVIHLAANSDVKGGSSDPLLDFRVNAQGTMGVLEFMRLTDTPQIAFASSSTVYGEATQLPTPETYGPYLPISSYGASKMAGEGFIAAYSHYYDFKSTIFRFANIVGKNSTHGVIFDFINKLKKDNKTLEILGDGTQRKSYMHVTDCVGSILFVHEKLSKTDIVNLGNIGTTPVTRIADSVTRAMHLGIVKYRFTGGLEGRGWKGDVKVAELSIDKLTSLGWKNSLGSDAAVDKAVRESLVQLSSSS